MAEGYSKACCTIPPVISQGYEPKGKYIELNGMKTYVTGPPTSKKALFIIYDIFGFFPQTLQGADILSSSTSTDPDQTYTVFMPDLFEGSPAPISWYPPDNEDKKAKLGKFFAEKAGPGPHLEKVPGLIRAAERWAKGEEGGKFEAGWGVVGFCWGGKIATLLAKGEGEKGLFRAAVQCHPAMLDAGDAKEVRVPMAVLASMDEDRETVRKFGEELRGNKDVGGAGEGRSLVKTWEGQIHGWMAARADLGDEEVKREYGEGYKTVLGFLRENM
ncbi:hypothetical protein FQN54_008777 [Arachnomyces sp. PD_36]|nr:hypothetical protein FQN54_008777 [Arachnomyces sp. PD_36]